MSLLISALQPSLTPGLLDVSGSATRSLGEILTGQGGFHPVYESTRILWKLDFSVRQPIAMALASECGKLACASFQTFSSVSDDIKDAESVPWAIIKSYYSAYYAGHSLLRAFGWSCTYLHGSQVQLLRKILDAYSVVDHPKKKGLYKVQVVDAGTVLELSAVNSNGVHEGFWKVFQARLSELIAGVLSPAVLPAADAQEVWSHLSSFNATLTYSGSNLSWLSTFRNTVQYRQEKNVWFPTKLPKPQRELLSRIAQDWCKSPDEITMATNAGELGQFLSACTFLVALCRELLVRVGSRCASGKSFAEYGPLRYLNSSAT